MGCRTTRFLGWVGGMIALAATAASFAAPAHAAFPGLNGPIVFSSDRLGSSDIWIMRPGELPVPLAPGPGLDRDPVISPNGKRIAFTSDRSGNDDIWAMNVDGTDLVRLTESKSADRSPAFAPDGSEIAFDSMRVNGQTDVYVMNADGSNETRMTTDPASDATPAFSPDGDWIAFMSTRTGEPDIWVMTAAGANPVNLTTHPSSDRDPSWSPSGERMAFTSDRAGNDDIWSIATSGLGLKQVTESTGSEQHAAYSADGTKIAYRSYNGHDTDLQAIAQNGVGQAQPLVNTTFNEGAADWGRVTFKGTIVTAEDPGQTQITEPGPLGTQELSIEIGAKRKQRAAWAAVRLTCSLDCEVELGRRGRRIDPAPLTVILPAATPTRVKLRLGRRAVGQLGDRGRRIEITARASAGALSASATIRTRVRR